MCAGVVLNMALIFTSLVDGLPFFFSGFTLYVSGLYVYMDCGAGTLYFSYFVEIMTVYIYYLVL